MVAIRIHVSEHVCNIQCMYERMSFYRMLLHVFYWTGSACEIYLSWGAWADWGCLCGVSHRVIHVDVMAQKFESCLCIFFSKKTLFSYHWSRLIRSWFSDCLVFPHLWYICPSVLGKCDTLSSQTLPYIRSMSSACSGHYPDKIVPPPNVGMRTPPKAKT